MKFYPLGSLHFANLVFGLCLLLNKWSYVWGIFEYSKRISHQYENWNMLFLWNFQIIKFLDQRECWIGMMPKRPPQYYHSPFLLEAGTTFTPKFWKGGIRKKMSAWGVLKSHCYMFLVKKDFVNWNMVLRAKLSNVNLGLF